MRCIWDVDSGVDTAGNGTIYRPAEYLSNGTTCGIDFYSSQAGEAALTLKGPGLCSILDAAFRERFF